MSALQTLDADPEVDVIIVARGGGDFQNLLGFSDERVVRAAAACTTPLVSAIGHEADRPLLDDVADLRASTPTDAAKRVVPDVAEEFARVQQARVRLSSRVTSLLGHEIDRLATLRTRPALADPSWIVNSRADELTRTVARGAELIDRAVERSQREVTELRAHLRALSPQRTLDRGYAIVQRADPEAGVPGGAVIRAEGDAPAGTELLVTLASGAIGASSTGPATAAARTDDE